MVQDSDEPHLPDPDLFRQRGGAAPDRFQVSYWS